MPGDVEINLRFLGNLKAQILKGVVSVEEVDLVNGMEMADQVMLRQMEELLSGTELSEADADNSITDMIVISNLNPYISSVVVPHRNCLTILFFTGFRFGEMAGLKWKNVHLDRKTAKICETLVYGEEGRTKTRKSNRDIDLLPPAMDALVDQMDRTGRRSGYVFLDVQGKPLTTDHMREVIWKPALEKAGIEYRPMMQTRHTFATISLSQHAGPQFPADDLHEVLFMDAQRNQE